MGIETNFSLTNGTFYIKDLKTGLTQRFNGIKNVEFDGDYATIEPMPQYLQALEPWSCTFTCENVKLSIRTMLNIFGFKTIIRVLWRRLFKKKEEV